jgi:2-methylcitrate dehydratase PrpD
MTQGNSVTEPAQQLAGLVAQTRYEDLPSEVIERAKMSNLDTLAVIIAGSSQAGSGGVVNLVRG